MKYWLLTWRSHNLIIAFVWMRMWHQENVISSITAGMYCVLIQVNHIQIQMNSTLWGLILHHTCIFKCIDVSIPQLYHDANSGHPLSLTTMASVSHICNVRAWRCQEPVIACHDIDLVIQKYLASEWNELHIPVCKAKRCSYYQS